MRDQVRQGLHYIRHHRVIRTLITAGFGNSFAFGVITGLLVVYAVRQLGIPDDSARIGVLYKPAALGALIAGLVFGRIFRFDKAGRIAAITILISALLLRHARVRDGLRRRARRVRALLAQSDADHCERHHVPADGDARCAAVAGQRHRADGRLGWATLRCRDRRRPRSGHVGPDRRWIRRDPAARCRRRHRHRAVGQW